MLSQVTLGVNNIEAATEFYDAILSSLGYQQRGKGRDWTGYGDIGGIGINTLWILKPVNGKPATNGNGTTIALLATSRDAVDAFHRAALALGATNEGDPGIRAESHPDFYAAYIRDTDGNYLCAICHDPI